MSAAQMEAKVFTLETASKGLVLAVRTSIQRGEVVLQEEGNLRPEANMHSIQFSPEQHAHTNDFGLLRYAEHQCEPNCAIQFSSAANTSEQVTIRLVALTHIAEGNYVGFDYNSTECKLSFPFACDCGSERCVQTVKGFCLLDEQLQQRVVRQVGKACVSKAVWHECKQRHHLRSDICSA